METRNADIPQPIDLIAQQFCCHDSLLGDRQVRRSGRHDEDRASSARWSTVWKGDYPSDRVKDGVRQGTVNRFVCGFCGSGHEQTVSRRDDPLADCCDLLRRFAGAEHYFWNPLSHGPMVVDSGKPEVFKWGLT